MHKHGASAKRRSQIGRASTGLAVWQPFVIHEANRKEVDGILWSETNPLAVISDSGGDTVVHIGYMFEEGILVKDITMDTVVFSVDLEGEELVLRRELKEQEQ